MGKKIKRDPKSVALAQAILEQYQPETKEDVQDAMKDIFGPIFEAMLQGEMSAHLGYESNNHEYKATQNRRNGYNNKILKTTYGEIPINTPRDRDGTFEPMAIPKRTKDVSGIEDKVLSMYAKGMSQRDIASTIEDIYGFNISAETVSEITDQVIEKVEEWQNRPLKKFYAFLFVDCMYVSIKKEYETKEYLQLLLSLAHQRFASSYACFLFHSAISLKYLSFHLHHILILYILHILLFHIPF